MGSSKSTPVVQPIDSSDSVVAAVAREPNTVNAEAQSQARSRKRGIASTYARYSMANDEAKTKLGQ